MFSMNRVAVEHVRPLIAFHYQASGREYDLGQRMYERESIFFALDKYSRSRIVFLLITFAGSTLLSFALWLRPSYELASMDLVRMPFSLYLGILLRKLNDVHPIQMTRKEVFARWKRLVTEYTLPTKCRCIPLEGKHFLQWFHRIHKACL